MKKAFLLFAVFFLSFSLGDNLRIGEMFGLFSKKEVKCSDGEMKCEASCECGKGVLVCSNGEWIHGDIPSINIYFF